MVKLPISDYVAEYYKKQGIEFTFRQQAHFCWRYSRLLKDRLRLLGEILKVSDDKKMNQEIRERLDHEEKLYQYFMEDNASGSIYIVYPDDEEECVPGYFSSAQSAVLYGKQYSAGHYRIIKRYLFDRCPKNLTKSEEPDKYNTIQAEYLFTSDGEVQIGSTYEYPAPFNEFDKNRFENMFLNIRTPFGIGDIVMYEYFDSPAVVHTDYDRLEKLYDRHKNDTVTWLDYTDNCISIDWIEEDGHIYSDNADPFIMWKIDSWRDKEYWDLLQMLSKGMKAGVDVFELDYQIREYAKKHKGEVCRRKRQ